MERAVVMKEVEKMIAKYKPTISLLRNATSLSVLKQSQRNCSIRIIQIRECMPVIRQSLDLYHFSRNLIDLIIAFTLKSTTEGIVVWQSEENKRVFKSDCRGYALYANERLDLATYETQRDDIDTDTLSPKEKLAYNANTSIVDEIESMDMASQPLADLEWISPFSAYMFDGEGSEFVYVFGIATFTESIANDHCIEFGWRMDVPSEKVYPILTFLRNHTININLKTEETTLEEM